MSKTIKREESIKKMRTRKVELNKEELDDTMGIEVELRYPRLEKEEYRAVVQANKGAPVSCFFVQELGYLYFRELNMGEIIAYQGIFPEGVSSDEKERVAREVIDKTLLYPCQEEEVAYVLEFLVKKHPFIALRVFSFLLERRGEINWKCEEIDCSKIYGY
ncbi:MULTISPECIES: hypothetical protein [unclassified Borrelia]|uniref:hypothetical protein n=1 Tax=unclassified Borrelia TaxID=2649934 RepID=UPI001E4F88F2|nr:MULTISPECIES: hypothetical protein [unclassified Borrelia]UGQ16686.1 hypothetical protein LSO06_05045 [Borrelia sp. RT5S]UGQ17844.1 hypothetical protein LSO05_05280 [Borrelia sp. RT1S]